MKPVAFDGGTIAIDRAALVRCVAGGRDRWTCALPAPPDSYFQPNEAEALVAGGVLLVRTNASHAKDDTAVAFGRLHRVDAGGALRWTVMPDPRCEGMLAFATTAGLVVVAPWEATPEPGAPPTLVARLLDPETGEERARRVIDTTSRRTASHATATMTLATTQTGEHVVFVRSRVAWGAVHAELPPELGAPVLG